MNWVWSALYLALLLVTGLCTLTCIQGRRPMSLPGGLGLSTLVGAGVVGTLLFWMSLIGLRPTRYELGAVALVALAGLVAMGIRGRRIVFVLPRGAAAMRRRDWAAILPTAILGLCAIGVLCQTVLPLDEIDAFGIWCLKAKVLWAESLRSSPALLREPCLAYSHQDYPLMAPMLTAGLFALAGHSDDMLGKMIGAFFYLGMCGAAYGFFRWRLSRFWAATMAAVLMGLPELQRWASVGMADFPLAAFLAGLAICLIRWLADGRREDLILAALFAAFAGSTKNEGLANAGIAMLALGAASLPGLRKVRIVGWLGFVAMTAVLLLPVVLWQAGQPSGGEQYGRRIFSPVLLDNLPRLATVLPILYKALHASFYWGISWALPPVLAILGWRAFARRETLLPWLMGLGQLSLYVAVYLVAADPPESLMPGTASRLILHLMPTAVLAAGLHLAAALQALPDRSISSPTGADVAPAPKGNKSITN